MVILDTIFVMEPEGLNVGRVLALLRGDQRHSSQVDSLANLDCPTLVVVRMSSCTCWTLRVQLRYRVLSRMPRERSFVVAGPTKLPLLQSPRDLAGIPQARS